MELRFRQIHMDFHTSEAVQDIGASFDPEHFAETLEKARVDSVTCFARCHHGWLYYPSKRHPERVHPHLKSPDLLNAQIEACHKRDIRVPIYVTVQWDHYTSQRHPEWCVITEKGELMGTPPYEPGFYRSLCVNSPYRDFLKEHVRDVFECVPVVDGLFFDIVQELDCSCQYCLAGMLEKGYDPEKPEQRKNYAHEMLNGFKLEMSDFVRELAQQEATIFYNMGHVGPYVRESQSAYSHYELESLPSGGWGYLHFPLSMRYARPLGLDCLGMTGKFHTSWGDFGSFKNQAALEYECFQMLALNAKCSVGDQLPPHGKISAPVYDLIGAVFSQVEQKEPWCRNARALAEIAVMTPEEWTGERVPTAAAGAVRMLEEGGHQFDLVDSQSSLDAYSVLILPDRIPLDKKLAEKINAFIQQGGKVIASFESALNPEKTAFQLEKLGVTLAPDYPKDGLERLEKEKRFWVDYLVPKGKLAQGLPETEHVMYVRAIPVETREEILADVVAATFDRDWRHFCSHRHSPPSDEVTGPAVVQGEGGIYFAHPVFSLYQNCAPRWCKEVLLNALELLLPEPRLRHKGPSTMRAVLNEQPSEKRWVMHLLHYVPERRSETIDIIEDVIPLYDIECSIRCADKPGAVRLAPEGQDIPFHYHEGRIHFTVPSLFGHAMVEIAFE